MLSGKHLPVAAFQKMEIWRFLNFRLMYSDFYLACLVGTFEPCFFFTFCRKGLFGYACISRKSNDAFVYVYELKRGELYEGKSCRQVCFIGF